MTDTERAQNRARPVVLVGAGPRPKELGAVLATLGAVRARMDGESVLEPHRPMGLSDLEELLSQRPAEGTLILDYERVPGEDIGFVRRFLERHAEWRLVVVGEDVKDRRARGLLALPRAQWLPWPPDLDQIGALLPRADDAARQERPPARPARRTSKKRRPAPGPARGEDREGEPLDVGALLEELLAGQSLDDGAPRYLYRCDHPTLLDRERAPLAQALDRLIALACFGAGRKGVVSAAVDQAPEPGDPEDTVRLVLEFPAGKLPADAWPVLLEKRIEVAGDDGEVVEGARRAAAELAALGARLLLTTPQDGRLRLDLFLASEPLATESVVPRKAKAEDPFA